MSWITQDVLFGHCFVLKNTVLLPNIRWTSTQRGVHMTGDCIRKEFCGRICIYSDIAFPCQINETLLKIAFFLFNHSILCSWLIYGGEYVGLVLTQFVFGY
jgi:hypothetical protein